MQKYRAFELIGVAIALIAIVCLAQQATNRSASAEAEQRLRIKIDEFRRINRSLMIVMQSNSADATPKADYVERWESALTRWSAGEFAQIQDVEKNELNGTTVFRAKGTGWSIDEMWVSVSRDTDSPAHFVSVATVSTNQGADRIYRTVGFSDASPSILYAGMQATIRDIEASMTGTSDEFRRNEMWTFAYKLHDSSPKLGKRDVIKRGGRNSE